jgi:para-nitrobenzyl esterase
MPDQAAAAQAGIRYAAGFGGRDLAGLRRISGVELILTATDRHLATTTTDAWARFVHHGDPNGADLPPWPRFDGTDDAPVLHLGDTIEPAPLDRIAAMHLLDRLPRPL